jgi:hypothetical protein
MRLPSGGLSDDREGHFSSGEVLHAFVARQQLAVRRKDRRNTDQILGSNTRITEGQLERSEALPMFANAFGQK